MYAQSGSQTRVPYRHPWPLPGRHICMPNDTQRLPLSRQAWTQLHLPRQCSQPSRPSTLLAATAKPVAHPEAVRAEFSEAGIPGDVVTKVLRCYPPYLRWPIDTKLRPALQLWLTKLGSRELSKRLDTYPRLLTRTPEECDEVYVWLASLGVDAERVQQKAPKAIARQLHEVQSVVWAVQHLLQLTDEQLPRFFYKQPASLNYSADRVAHTLQTVAELLALPMASKEMQQVITVSSHWLFAHDHASLHRQVSFFCKEFKGGQRAAKAALKQSVYQVSAGLMRERAAELRRMLGWTEEDCNHAVSLNPRILTHQPSTVANNIQKLQAHNFSSAQALKICAARPSLAGYDWSSPSNVEKLMFLMLFLQLTTAELASKPVLLSISLERRVGPRCEFVYRSRAISFDTTLQLSGCSSYIDSWSDAEFAAKFNIISACPPLVYDEVFKQHWWQRWNFLRHEMALSVADISACRALLCMSLPNTLAPRWRCLTRLEAAQADFRAADHLTALASLSDQRFAETFDMLDAGLQ